MNELRRLISDKLKGLDWVRFFRSNNATIKASTVKERETFLREFKQEIDYGFSYASQICQVSIDFVRQNFDRYLDNDIYYSINSIHALEFVDRILDWQRMFPFIANFDEDILERFRNEVNWKELLTHKQFTAQFINRNLDYFIWLNKQYRSLSLWKTLSYYQNLNDQFIEKYEKKLDWELMSASQPFSEHIMLKYIDKINWEEAIQNKDLYLTWPVEKELREKGIL